MRFVLAGLKIWCQFLGAKFWDAAFLVGEFTESTVIWLIKMAKEITTYVQYLIGEAYRAGVYLAEEGYRAWEYVYNATGEIVLMI